MEKKLENKLKNFNNVPDGEKYAILVELSDHLESDEIVQFLFDVIEKERYEKIRIKAVLILKTCDKPEIVQKLSELYAYEREKSVRLALIEALAKMTSEKIEDLLSDVATKDENDVIRSAAIRNLHERKKVGKKKMRTLLLDIIQNDRSIFPKQLALNLVASYADKETQEILKLVYNRESKFRMRQLIHKTMSEVAKKVKIDFDIEEPRDEMKKKDESKKGRRKRKKRKKEEEYLYF